MHRVAEGIENRRHVPVDVLLVVPDIRHRHRNIFRKRARTIDAYPLCVLAKMPSPGQTVAATAADHMALGADDFVGEKIGHVRTDLNHRADEFMADDHWHGNGLLRPGVPFVNVQVCATDARAIHPDQHVVDADRRHGDLFQPQTGFGFAL